MDVNKICRMCSTAKSRLKSIFEGYVEENLVQTISNILQLSITANDGMPSKICKPCVNVLVNIRKYVEQFREHDKTLRHKIFDSANIDIKVEEGPQRKTNLVCSFRKKPKLKVQNKPSSLPIIAKQEPLEEKTLKKDDECEKIKIEPDDSSEFGSDSDYAPLQLKRKIPTKSNPQSTKPNKPEFSSTEQQKNVDINRPKLNDYKCYICGSSESMGSAKDLLEHLTVHLDMIPHTCNECIMETVVLKNVRSLNIHKKMHAQPVKCEYCDRRYNGHYSRDVHVKTFHLGENAPCPSTCDLCGKVCKSIAALKNHKRDHKINVKCDYCGKVFHRMFNLREHVTQVHEKAGKYNCKLCNKTLQSLETYNTHLKLHIAEKTYLCDLCPMKFNTAGALGIHKKVHARNANYKPQKDWSSHYTIQQDVERGKIYTCNHCGNYSHRSLNNFIGHVKNHFKDIQCDKCDLKFTSMSSLKLHSVVHTRERKIRCDKCEKDFMYRSQLTKHIKNEHGPERTEDKGEDALALTVEPKTMSFIDATKP